MDQTPPASSSSPGSGNGVDPFATLFKMSTTAGLGSAEYVAINGTSITTVVLGLASALMLFGSPILLVIPLAGLICGFVAVRQVAHSNGTQTGRGLASLGLLLSLGFGGFFVFNSARSYLTSRADQHDIVALINQLSQHIHQGASDASAYDKAYDLCDEHFKQKVARDSFVGRLKAVNASQLLGAIKAMAWNGQLEIQDDKLTGERLASCMVTVTYEKVPDEGRHGMVFRRTGDRWMIDEMPTIFPAEPPADPNGGKSGPRSAPTVPMGPAGPPAPM